MYTSLKNVPLYNVQYVVGINVVERIQNYRKSDWTKANGPLNNAEISARYVILKHLIKLYVFKVFILILHLEG